MSRGNGCPNCERLEKLVEQLQAQLAQQVARIEELERKLAAATKNSSNSSKPPSSDIVKPKKRKLPGKRKRGGQKGHQRNVRPLLAEDQLDWLMQYSYEQCPDCGGSVAGSGFYPSASAATSETAVCLVPDRSATLVVFARPSLSS